MSPSDKPTELMATGNIARSGSNKVEATTKEVEGVLAGLIETELSKGGDDWMDDDDDEGKVIRDDDKGKGLLGGTSHTQQQNQWIKQEEKPSKEQPPPPAPRPQQRQKKKRSARQRSKGIVRSSESKDIGQMGNICPGGTMLVVSNYGKELNQEHACRYVNLILH
jgi:hypothetical protein